jgi:RimJ/RimL family protein N-acetyltransferase
MLSGWKTRHGPRPVTPGSRCACALSRWALRREFWGRGYASEIGRAGLAFAFDVLGVQAVVSCTVRHNVRSRAVMERIGMRYAGEIQSRGTIEGLEGVQDDAPFAVCVLLRRDWDESSSAPVVT